MNFGEHGKSSRTGSRELGNLTTLTRVLTGLMMVDLVKKVISTNETPGVLQVLLQKLMETLISSSHSSLH
jgi:hypothetical protein